MPRCYRVLFSAFLGFLLICCVACDGDDDLTAINPFFRESDRIYNADLVGDWISTGTDQQTYLKVEEMKPDPPAVATAASDSAAPNDPEKVHWYKVTISSQGRQSVWIAHLFKLADDQFLDVYPFDRNAPFNVVREYSDYAIRLHGLFRMKMENDEIHLAEAVDTVAEKQIPKEATILEQSTEELQRIVKAMGTPGGAYRAEMVFSRPNSRQHFTRLMATGSLGICEHLVDRRHWEEALPYCKKATELLPQRSSAHHTYAVALAGVERGAEARKEFTIGFNACREISKTGWWDQDCREPSASGEKYLQELDSSEHMMMALSFFADRQWADAAQHFSMMNVDDRYGEMRFYWALSLYAIGKREEAVALLKYKKPVTADSPDDGKPTQDDLIRALVAEYFEGRIDGAGFESKWDKPSMGSGMNEYLASLRYARGDWKGAAELYKTMGSSETLGSYNDFLANLRLRQIEAEQHRPSLKRVSRRAKP